MPAHRSRAPAAAAAACAAANRPKPPPVPAPAASRGWRAAVDEEEGELREEGELPPAGRDTQQGAAQGPAARDGSPVAGGDSAARKRKHAPIVWHTPPKAARGGGMAHVGSSKGLDALAAGGGGAAAKTAADRAMEELAAFQQQQAAEGSGEEEGGQPFMKPSPSVSSEEEEEAAARGGCCCAGCWRGSGRRGVPAGAVPAHCLPVPLCAVCKRACCCRYAQPLQQAFKPPAPVLAALPAGRSASGSPAKRAAQGEGEQHTAPSAQPKRASRWMSEEAAEEPRGAAASPDKAAAAGAPGDAVSDAEQPSGGSQQEGGEDEGEDSPRRPVCVAARCCRMLWCLHGGWGEALMQPTGLPCGCCVPAWAARPRPIRRQHHATSIPVPCFSAPSLPRRSKKAVNMLEECRSVDIYEKLNRISEGTYGVVYRCGRAGVL